MSKYSLISIYELIRRASKKPPRIILERLGMIVKLQADRYLLPRRGRISDKDFLTELHAHSVDDLWSKLSQKRYFTRIDSVSFDSFISSCGDAGLSKVMNKADQALSHKVDLLGSGCINIGKIIEWNVDFKTKFKWNNQFFYDIEYCNLTQSSDVKVPWELSRLQWLISVGQAYLLTKDEKYADFAKNILVSWIASNPFAQSVNWSCTMEAAIRIFTWTWFFHVFKNSNSWCDSSFRIIFLRYLYLHVEFTEKYIEKSDVNGNHYIADAAGLAIGGMFFYGLGKGKYWHQSGWQILTEEIHTQVLDDGVDYEASVPYHRLVAEIFLYPALYRESEGLLVDNRYKNKLHLMSQFTLAYTRQDGICPLWGDADDARVIPFGFQDVNDHRYLVSCIGIFCNQSTPIKICSDSISELYWLFQDNLFSTFVNSSDGDYESRAFVNGGFYILRAAKDHVFIDCGPVGLQGRGGHGHNDCLSFSAYLDNCPLVSDRGAYLYTSSVKYRNEFRSTASHNTPRVDDLEINRFIKAEYLWNLHYDAVPNKLIWHDDENISIFGGEHYGYHRLLDKVTPQRFFVLDKASSSLLIADKILGASNHIIDIPFYFSNEVKVIEVLSNSAILSAHPKEFCILFSSTENFSVKFFETSISKSYGVKTTSYGLKVSFNCSLPVQLLSLIKPIHSNSSTKVLTQLLNSYLSHTLPTSLFRII